MLDDYFVTCAATGEQIPLSLLRYWNVDTQHAYARPTVMPVYKGLPFYDGP